MSAAINPGVLAEELTWSWPEDRTLTPEERAALVDYAHGFEECGLSRDSLSILDDQGLVSATYHAMADYARGQM